VFKAHPAHPGTSELAAGAISRAAATTGVPAGVFSLLHGWSYDVGLSLVRHPKITAVGFTGSLRGGRAIFDAAAARPEPIPVYAEMGSINPVFLLPSAMAERSAALAQGLATSIAMGVGQFCTNPGVILGVRGVALDNLAADLAAQVEKLQPGVMLYGQLRDGYTKAVERAGTKAEVLARGGSGDDALRAQPALLRTDGAQFLADRELHEEIFGPVSVIVAARDYMELERVAESLEGQLTATIHGTPEELHSHARLVEILTRKVGRLLFNGFPTGVEVGHAMQHGGPYPASSDSRTTSVGTAAIERFVRPVCYQNFPDASLPAALRNKNSLGIWRLVNGAQSQADL
jgi:NADP-dependent aldehyde dehydrogenase